MSATASAYEPGLIGTVESSAVATSSCLDCPQPAAIGSLCTWHWHRLSRLISARWEATEVPVYLGPELPRRTATSGLLPPAEQERRRDRDAFDLRHRELIALAAVDTALWTVPTS